MFKLLFSVGVRVMRSRKIGQPSAWPVRALSSRASVTSSALLEHIKTKILMRGGPLSIAEYMQDCLTSPQGGFYMTRDVFGSSGDFVTSPEISQLFGEMVGIWCVHTWMTMGRPPRLLLVELGPGRGTLMADLLRGTAAFREFSSSLELHLVEISPALRAVQWGALICTSNSSSNGVDSSSRPSSNSYLQYGDLQGLAMTPNILGKTATAAAATEGLARAPGPPPPPPPPSSPSLLAVDVAATADGTFMTSDEGTSGFNGCRVYWHASLDSVPDGPAPALYIAHEFFDALPVHQFVQDPKRGWLEKMVDMQTFDENDNGGGSAAASSTSATEHVDPDQHQNPNSEPRGSKLPSRSESPASPTSATTTTTTTFTTPAPSSRSSPEEQGSPPGTSRSGGGDGGDAGGRGDTYGSGLRLVLSPGPTPAAALLIPRRLAGLARDKVEGLRALEVSAVGMAVAEKLAQRIVRYGGAALVVDYGREEPPYGDSLMAIRGHRGVGILDAPGSADLSAWVDFGALKLAVEGAAAAAARLPPPPPLPSPPAATAAPPAASVTTSGPVSQASFLRALGIEMRSQWLARRAADPAAAEALTAGCARLLGGSESGGMGESYKVMAIHRADLRDLAGF